MKRGNAFLIIIFAAFVVVASISVSYFVAQNIVKNKQSAFPIPNIVVSALPKATQTPQTPAPENKTVVVYESEASIPANDRSQLQKRVVEPVIDYYEMEATDPAVSVKIKINTQASKADYPYLFEYILKSGANGGGVIAKINGEINWWYPECLNGCNLSTEFSAKYPEIEALVN